MELYFITYLTLSVVFTHPIPKSMGIMKKSVVNVTKNERIILLFIYFPILQEFASMDKCMSIPLYRELRNTALLQEGPSKAYSASSRLNDDYRVGQSLPASCQQGRAAAIYSYLYIYIIL